MSTRELTLKEQTTAGLLARLEKVTQLVSEPIDPVVKLMYRAELETIELELEEREMTERKVSRW